MLSEFWQVNKLPSKIRSASNFLRLLQNITKKIPFEVQQMLHTWQDDRAIYWMRFGDNNQAMHVQGYLSCARVSNSDGCDGLAVFKAMYLLALEEVRNSEKRPASPTNFWNIPVMLDTRFVKSMLHKSSSSCSTETAFPLQVYLSLASLKFEASTLKLITPNTNHSAIRPSSSPPGATPLSKRSCINLPPQQFVAFRTTCTICETTASRNTKQNKLLALQLSQLSPDTEEHYHSPCPKGLDSHLQHNHTRYH
ncbi:hypothetical protein BDN71DRAFT_1510328 [Pleurotus eryngii]|uniref:Uncharacterized protein n=1 Tax=Pleurotus eryngii TaxID=5323 RepID=A0A9P5ZNT0_PLEER|nr:hypothetical protein BDN71DRAFT_1510328 [Pleurotus eryngii]